MNNKNTLKNWLLKRVSLKDTAQLKAKGIYILPTKEGIFFAFLVLLLLSAAINFNNSLIFFCSFLLAGIGIISMHMTQQNLLNLQFSTGHIKPVFSGQKLSIPLLVTQCGKKNKTINKYSIAVQFARQTIQHQELIDVPADEKVSLTLSATTVERGYFNLPPISISTLYPLGLFHAWSNIQLSSNALVYPMPADKQQYQPQSGENNEGQGQIGRGLDDFSGFKSYQPGDSLKHIHWKAYAREQGLLSKVFCSSSHQHYWLDWQTIPGDTEHRLSLLCRLIIDAEQKNDHYGLILPGKRIAIAQGIAHYHQCLKALALYQNSGHQKPDHQKSGKHA